MTGMTEAFVGLGSNIQPRRHLRAALVELRGAFGEVAASPVYQNPAVGFAGDDFLNLVVRLETELSLAKLILRLQAIEARCGRERSEERWGPRTLDLDLLTFGDQVSEQPPLPRADVLKRAFVLRPLAELAPAVRHPVDGRTYAELWAAFDQANCSLKLVDLREPGEPRQSKVVTLHED